MENQSNLMLAWSIGWVEILIIFMVALIVFGKRLPQVARDLGKSLNQFKKGLKETKDEVEKDINKEEKS